KVHDLEQRFFEKYGIFPPCEEYLKDPERWYVMDGYDVVAVVPDRQWYKTMPGNTYSEKSKNWEMLLKKNRSEFYKHILKNNRFLTLRIDTGRDKTIIERAISKKLDWITENKRKFRLGKNYDKTVHLDKFQRYFAVWDLVQQRQKLWSFSRIAYKLKKDGWYKKQTPEEAEILARQDYRTACRWIRTPVKINKRALRKTLKPIIKLKEGKKHKELFEEWEERLKREGLGLDEFRNEEKDQIIYNRTDGPTKQRFKRELIKNEEWKRR
ncbi:MAG: hypothetical protein Q8N14_06210, partial [Candidatus Omnitrophota bacterium]|nr:hypothetical protein [Candidatus Omnitrophota bacterium]